MEPVPPTAATDRRALLPSELDVGRRIGRLQRRGWIRSGLVPPYVEPRVWRFIGDDEIDRALAESIRRIKRPSWWQRLRAAWRW